MNNKKSNTPKSNGAAPSAPPMKTASAPPVKAPSASTGKNNKKLPVVIIAIIAVLVIGAVILAVVLKNAQDTGKLPEDTTKEFVFYATDENGIAVTDENGMAVTVIPETTVVALTTQRTETVTDKNGEKVTDKNGENLTTVISEEVTNAKGDVLTTVIYQDVQVTVPVAVTNEQGAQVTDAKGEEVTEIVTLPQNPNEQKPGDSVIMGTSSVVITDGAGNTAVDNKGDVYTSMVELTSNPDKVAPASIDWKTSLGGTEADYFSSIAVFENGDYIAANVTNSTNGDFAKYMKDGFPMFATPYTVLIKYNSKGNEDWRVAAGSLMGQHIVTDVVVADDGGFYTIGYGRNVGGENLTNVAGKGYYDGFVYKYDENGKEQWHKVFGTTTVDLFNAAALTSDGGIVVVGSVGDNDGDAAGFNKPTKESAIVAVKYTADGKLAWKNIFGGNMDTLNDVCIGNDNSIYAVGNFASGTLFKNHGKTDGGVVKLSSTGKFISAVPLAGSGNEGFSGITACKDGGVVVVGRSNSKDTDSTNSLFAGDKASKGGYDAYLIKLNNDLSINFVKPFRGQNNDDLVDIVEKEDGSFIATGSSNSSTRDFKGITTRGGDDIVIASFDKFGNLTWVRSFGGTADESANALCLSPKGGYAVAGRTLSKNIDMAGIAQYVNGKSVGVVVKFPE